MFRALVALPGGIRGFIPCEVGANHCRLRHIGWERCGHGLTSRPRESASEGFLSELLALFGYPSGSAAALLNGVLPFGTVLGSLLVGFTLGRIMRGSFLLRPGLVWDNSLGCACPRLQACMFWN